MTQTPYRTAVLQRVAKAITGMTTREECIAVAEALAMSLATVAGSINRVGSSDRAIEEIDWRLTDANKVLDLLEVPNA